MPILVQELPIHILDVYWEMEIDGKHIHVSLVGDSY
jgi:hypothetical protein